MLDERIVAADPFRQMPTHSGDLGAGSGPGVTQCMAAPRAAVRVFISPSSSDSEEAVELARLLAARGIECLVDAETRPHEDGIIPWIESMIAKSTVVLVLHGRRRMGRWQNAEAKIA